MTNLEENAVEKSESIFLSRGREISSLGVSWGAVLAGAFVAAALSLILLALGAGLGLSAVSPWSTSAWSNASLIGTAAILWLIAGQVIASSMGGYLVGRLRTRWQSIHNDEVHFRDTANGLVAWAVGVVMTVAFLATAATTMAGAAANAAEDTRDTPRQNSHAYYVDRLFRSDRPSADRDSAVQAEASRILTRSLLTSSTADTDYLAQLVAAKTGLSPSDAANRVSQTLADARQSEDDVRKAAAHALLWIFIALLSGAFCASYAATIGGRQRDHVRMI